MMHVCARMRGRDATKEEILSVHSPEVWQAIETASRSESADARKAANVARTAAGCVLEMCNATQRCELKNGWALVRPGGHTMGRELEYVWVGAHPACCFLLSWGTACSLFLADLFVRRCWRALVRGSKSGACMQT